MLQIQHDEQRHHHQNETGGEAGDGLDAGGTLRTFDDGDAGVAEAQILHCLVAGEVKEDMETIFVMAHDEAGHKLLDDLAEGQSHDGQIVALEPQHGSTHDEAGDGGEQRAHDHGDGQPQTGGGDHIQQALRSDDAREGTYAHKARMPQTQLTKDAHRQVQGHSHRHIAADGDQQAGHGTVQNTGLAEGGHHEEKDGHP